MKKRPPDQHGGSPPALPGFFPVKDKLSVMQGKGFPPILLRFFCRITILLLFAGPPSCFAEDRNTPTPPDPAAAEQVSGLINLTEEEQAWLVEPMKQSS